MPTRIIREGILDSKAVNALSEPAEILYRRLMSVVDDFGRFEADEELIRARCFPRQLERWPTVRIGEVLLEIGDSPLITVYHRGNKKFLQINNFGQRIQSKTSKYPDPDTVERGIPPESTVNHGESPESTASRARAQSESKTYAKTETEASAETPPARPILEMPPRPITGPTGKPIPADFRQRIHLLADDAPDPQDYQAGVDLAVQLVMGSANPKTTLDLMEANVPAWWAAMRGGMARVKTFRYLVKDSDWMKRPREPTKKKSQSSADEYPTYIPPVIPDDEDARI